jgi:hypothetical protein
MTEHDKCPHCDAEIYINDGDYIEWECGADKCHDGAGEWFHSRSSNCYEREIEQLRTERAALRAENERLTAENAKLREAVARLRKTDDAVPMVPGETYWAWCRDRWADDDESEELLEVVWWRGGGDDCFNPEFTFANDSDAKRLYWEYFDVEGVFSTRAAAEAAQAGKEGE